MKLLNNNYKILILFLIFVQYITNGQDIQFSQFYTANLYQNPAFAGSSHVHRVMAHSRIQWAGLNQYGNNGGKFFTYFGAFDTYFRKQKSGLAVMALRDEMGLKRIINNEIYAMYSYEVFLNNKLTFRPGIQLGISQRSYDYQNLLFPRELSDDGIIDNSYTLNIGTNKIYPDVSSGFLLYTKKFWFGYSAHHINTPNVATFGKSDLPVKHALTGGYKIILKTVSTLNYSTTTKAEYSLTPTAHYKFQGKSDQYDVGVYGIFDWMLVGLWYRGIPFKTYDKLRYINNESMIVQGGIKWDRWCVNYSYDFVVSKLGGVRQTGGSHEINLTYTFKPHVAGHINPTKRLPCPTFEKEILNEDGKQ